MAGGILDGADLSLSYVARGKERVPVDFVKLVRNGDLSQNIALDPDDIVVIPDNPQNVIYVTGEVKQPGMLPFVKERDWTALKAVVAVGGFTQFAAKSKAYLIREGPSGRAPGAKVFHRLPQRSRRDPRETPQLRCPSYPCR